MEIRLATTRDLNKLASLDPHIQRQELVNAIQLKRVYVFESTTGLVGWMRYNLFWDSIPFLNLLYCLKEERGKGYGRHAMTFWENEMRRLGHKRVMTSTVAQETAQHFYYRLGYQAIGGFTLTNEPYELLLEKSLI